MSDYNYFEYPPAMWLREYPDLREARGLSETQTIDRCLELRRRWMAAGLSGQTICNFRLDNPYATDDALLCLVNRARLEIHNKATGHKDSPGGSGFIQQANLANDAICTPFYVQAAGGLSVGHISFVVQAADGSNNSDVSINNGTTGALIADIGAQHLASTGVVNAAFVQGTVTIPTGKNFLCETSAGSTMALYFYSQVPENYQIDAGSLATTSGGAMGAITVPSDSGASANGIGPWILLYP